MSKRTSLKREQINAALRVAMNKIGKLQDGEKTPADVRLFLEMAYHVTPSLVAKPTPAEPREVKP